MKIGIIGTGAIGGTLAKKISDAGHQVKVANTRDMATLKEIAADLGAEAATLEDVVNDVEVIILSIPTKAYKDLPETLFQNVPEAVPILDTANYYQLRDGEMPELTGKVESIYVSEVLGRPVVKIFNNMLAYTLEHKGKQAGETGRIAISVAGDNEEHKKIVAGLVDQIGFDTVDGGSLAESWRQELGSPAYCTDLSKAEMKEALELVKKEKIPAAKELVLSKFQNLKAAPSHEELVAINRSVYSIYQDSI